MDVQELATVVNGWGYLGLLVMLLLTGVGSPVPEDLLLLAAGYLASSGVLGWPEVAFTCLLGVVGSDVIVYAAGRRLVWHSERWPEGHFLSPARLRKATRWFDRWGNVLVLIARLVPGTRALVFATAGIRGVPFKSFLGYDCAGALLWVVTTLLLGREIGDRVGGVPQLTELLSQQALWVASVAASLLMVWLAIGREQSKL